MFRSDERGFSLIEILVAISLFSVISVGFYSVLFSSVKSADTTRQVVGMSEEARLGFNRIVRDTREGNELLEATDTSFRVQTDFDADGTIESPNEDLDYEDVRYIFDPSAATITLEPTIDPSLAEVLMSDVACQAAGCPVFTYTSNRLQYDTSPFDGVVTKAELEASSIGNNNGTLDVELPLISSVTFQLAVFDPDETSSRTDFAAEAQLRNRR